MKVCILTFAVTNNYGATLQCYALSKFIQQQGHETIILNVPLQRAGAPRYKVKLIKRIKNKIYNPQIQIFAKSETKRHFFECSFKTKRTKKGLAHNTNNKARNKSQNHSISGLALSSTIQQAI